MAENNDNSNDTLVKIVDGYNVMRRSDNTEYNLHPNGTTVEMIDGCKITRKPDGSEYKLYPNGTFMKTGYAPRLLTQAAVDEALGGSHYNLWSDGDHSLICDECETQESYLDKPWSEADDNMVDAYNKFAKEQGIKPRRFNRPNRLIFIDP